MSRHLLWMILFALQFASAADEARRVDFFAIKSSIEDMITKRYHDRIATLLPKDLFTVAVEVDLEYRALDPNNFKDSSDPNLMLGADGLSDISLGIIDSLQMPPNASKDLLNNTLIKKVEVVIGVHSKVSAAFQDKLKQWAQA